MGTIPWWHPHGSFYENGPQVYGFVYLVHFVQFLPLRYFVGGVFEDLSASAKICQDAKNHPHL